MSDVFTREKRSEVMSKIRSRGNKETELAMVRLFRDHKIRGWRRHRSLFGKPDFTFASQKTVVFIDGCFWHGCPKHSNLPVNNRPFWRDKLEKNRRRDRMVTQTLRKQGWHVLRIWEHQLREPIRVIRRLRNLLNRCEEGDGC